MNVSQFTKENFENVLTIVGSSSHFFTGLIIIRVV